MIYFTTKLPIGQSARVLKLGLYVLQGQSFKQGGDIGQGVQSQSTTDFGWHLIWYYKNRICTLFYLPIASLPTYLLKKNTNHAHSQDLGCRLTNLNLVKLWVYVCMHGMNNRVRIEIFLIHTVTFTLKYFITMYATVLI